MEKTQLKFIDSIKTKATLIFPDNYSRILFVLSLFVLLSFWQTGMYLNDEAKSANQLTNFVHGSLYIKEQKIELNQRYYYTISGGMIAPYTHFLSVFALLPAAVLFLINYFFGIRLFFSIIWSACWYLLCLLIGKELKQEKNGHRIGLLSVPMLGANAAISIMLPVDFEVWWELLSLQFLNIILTAASILIIYHLFKRLFDSKAFGFFGGAFILFCTSITFWGISGKDHSAVVFLVSAAFYSFYQYSKNGNPIYHYTAYFTAALNVWVRLDSAVPLIISLLFVDIVLITKTKRFSSLIRISAVLLISLIPYFINNYMIYGNPLFPPQYAAQFGLSSRGDALVPTLEISNISQSNRNLLPYLNTFASVFDSSSFIGKTHAVFFHFNEKLSTVTAAIFEYSPFLALSIAGIIIFIFKRKTTGHLYKPDSAIKVLFLVYSAILALIYFKFVGSSAHDILPSFDMRYFATLQVSLLYFALMPVERLIRQDMARLVEYSAGITLMLGISVIILNNLVHWAGVPMDILLIMKYLGTSGIVFILISCILSCISRRAPKIMIAAVAFSLSVAFLWVLFTITKAKTAGLLEGDRTMIVPVADSLRKVLDYYIQFYRY
jgi:hypothetical protein